MVSVGGSSKSKFNEKCKKVESNKYYCEFEGNNGEKQGQVAVRGSRDGDKEVMETSFENLTKEEKRELIEETKSRVSVASGKPADSPFDSPSE